MSSAAGTACPLLMEMDKAKNFSIQIIVSRVGKRFCIGTELHHAMGHLRSHKGMARALSTYKGINIFNGSFAIQNKHLTVYRYASIITLRSSFCKLLRKNNSLLSFVAFSHKPAS